MDYKVLFFDVDGTLTSNVTGEIPTSTKRVIQSLREKGYHIIAATGRPLAMCDHIKELGIETFITANGAYATHQGKCIYKVQVTQEQVVAINQLAKQLGHSITFYSEQLNINEVLKEETYTILKEQFFEDLLPNIVYKGDEIETYLMCLFVTEEELAPYKEAFPSMDYFRWHPNIVNLLEQPSSKSVAIEHVLAYFGYTKEQAIAFGDGQNDIDMLEYVSFGVAMGNGSEQLKSIAQYVTADSHNDGIEKAVKELQLL